jgi:microcin C transport system substrate-binding protein
VPDEVFGEPYSPPRSDGSGQDRALLAARATSCGRQAAGGGDQSEAALRRGADARVPRFPADAAAAHAAFIRNLGLLGIAATSRLVDAAQYQRRTEEFDFDLVSQRYSTSPTPGETLRQVFGSRAAAIRGSQNIAGIADSAVDALLERIVAAETRPALTAACRALDRVLRAGRHWVPMWYRGTNPIAYWDLFGRPQTPPDYDLGAPATWWYEPEKARRIGRG